jgi:hypothetical protein
MKRHSNFNSYNNCLLKKADAIEKYAKDFSISSVLGIIENIEKFEFHMGSPNKKDQKFNIRIHKNDLIILDLISKEIEVKRSELIGSLLSYWTIDLFNQINRKDSTLLANHVDRCIDNENYRQHYQGRTWWWQLAEVYPENDHDGISYFENKDNKNG